MGEREEKEFSWLTFNLKPASTADAVEPADLLIQFLLKSASIMNLFAL